MTVMQIRKHSRFAVCCKAQLSGPQERDGEVLLVEVSLDGCRLGNLDSADYRPGQRVTMRLAGHTDLDGEVRWTGAGSVSLRFCRPLHVAALDALLRFCRPGPVSGLRAAG